SSLTMAWGVRLAQLGKQRGLLICLALTILGGYLFMGIKSIEYKTKWQHHLGVGHKNMYRPDAPGANAIPGGGEPAIGRPEHGAAVGEHHAGAASAPATTTQQGHAPAATEGHGAAEAAAK